MTGTPAFTVAAFVVAALAAATVIWTLVRLGRAVPVDRQPLREMPSDAVPSTLVAIRHATMSRAAGDVHDRLRPVLRQIAYERLRSAGVELYTEPEAAAARLGEEAYELVRPHRPPPADPFGAGPGVDALTRIVVTLEGL